MRPFQMASPVIPDLTLQVYTLETIAKETL